MRLKDPLGLLVEVIFGLMLWALFGLFVWFLVLVWPL